MIDSSHNLSELLHILLIHIKRTTFVLISVFSLVSLWALAPVKASTPEEFKAIPIGDSHPSPLVSVEYQGEYYFGADQGLWRTDGTYDGTSEIELTSTNPDHIIVSDNTIFYTYDGHLCKIDDSCIDGAQVADSIVSLNSILYFNSYTGGDTPTLWRSDGTSDGTYKIGDGYVAGNLIVFNNKIYFAGNAPNQGTDTQLWESDGKADGTVMVKDINPDGSSTPGAFTIFNGNLYFSAHTGNGWATSDYQLWKSDGTSEGTTVVKNIYLASSNR